MYPNPAPLNLIPITLNPQYGLLVYLALAWQTVSISAARSAAVAKRKKKKAADHAAAAGKVEADISDLKHGHSTARSKGDKAKQADAEPKKVK